MTAGRPRSTTQRRDNDATHRNATVLAAITGLIAAGPVAARQPGPTIVGTAIAVNQATGEFDELIAAVSRAGLVGALDGNRQFTVFAPTDAAFDELYAALGVEGVDDIPLATLEGGPAPPRRAGRTLQRRRPRIDADPDTQPRLRLPVDRRRGGVRR